MSIDPLLLLCLSVNSKGSDILLNLCSALTLLCFVCCDFFQHPQGRHLCLRLPETERGRETEIGGYKIIKLE